MRELLLALFLIFAATPSVAQECDFLHTVWQSNLNEYRRVVYFDEVGSPNHHSVVIEAWKGDELKLRVHGTLLYNKYGPEVGNIAILTEYVPSAADSQFAPSELHVSNEFLDVERLQEGSGDSGWLVLEGLSDQIRLLDRVYGEFFMTVGLQSEAYRKAGCREGPLEFALVEEDPNAPCKWKRGNVHIGDDMAFGVSTCTVDKSRAYFALSCSSQKGAIEIQYELAKGIDGAVSDGGPINVEFATEAGSWGLIMTGNDMDGTHVTEVGHVNPVIEYIANSSTLTISDKKGEYPIRRVSLEGSREAIDTLLRKCVGP